MLMHDTDHGDQAGVNGSMEIMVSVTNKDCQCISQVSMPGNVDVLQSLLCKLLHN